MVGKPARESAGNGVSRRTFVKAAGASGAAVSLAGCIYGDDGGGGEDTVVAGWDPNQAQDIPDDVRDLYYENGLSEDIEIDFRPGEENTGERRSNYIELLNAGETEPDVMLMDNGWLNVFIQRGLVANLNEEMDEEDVQRIDDEYFESFTETARDPDSGDIYGVPLFPDFPTMQYRKDYAREAGYDDSDFEEWATNPMTWQEWAEITAEIVEASEAEIGLSTQWEIYEGTSCCTFNEVMSSWGGAYFGGRENLFGPVGQRPVTVSEEETIDSLRMMRTFVDSGDENALEEYTGDLAPTEITSWQEEDAREAILDGRAVMQRNWPYAIAANAAEEELGTDNYGAMPMPYAVTEDEAAQPGTGGSTAALGGWHIVLNPNSESKDAAIEMLRASMADDFNLGMLEMWGWLPPKPGLFESEDAESIEPIGEYMDTLRFAGETAMPRPVTEQWPNQAEVIAQEANSAVGGSKSPEEAMNDLQSALEDTEEN